jgi:hypothetical protein
VQRQRGGLVVEVNQHVTGGFGAANAQHCALGAVEHAVEVDAVLQVPVVGGEILHVGVKHAHKHVLDVPFKHYFCPKGIN